MVLELELIKRVIRRGKLVKAQLATKIEEYPTERLKKEIKSSGWLLSIFGILLAYFIVEIILDKLNDRTSNSTLIFAVIAMAAGITPMFQRRKKMVKEMKGRDEKTDLKGGS